MPLRGLGQAPQWLGTPRSYAAVRWLALPKNSMSCRILQNRYAGEGSYASAGAYWQGVFV
ncbi:MAG: hypothetical protein QM579_00460 [Desulfovibrio sp.]|uniref:hypothetical protein n=1 Tax=Desulfovibrio sp. TaxID=885 RepID=UPI0039E37CA3